MHTDPTMEEKTMSDSNSINNSSQLMSTPATQSTDESQSTEQTQQSTPAEETGGMSEAEQTNQSSYDEDVWEEAWEHPYAHFGGSPDSAGSGDGSAADIDPDQAMSAWEMRAAIDSGKSVDGGTDASIMENNRVAGSVANLYQDLVERDVSSSQIGTEFNIQVFDRLDAAGRQELVELAGNSDELRGELEAIHGDSQLADQVIDEVESRVVSMAGERIAEQARPMIRETREGIEQIDSSSETRRAFLGSLAAVGDDADAIAEGLVDFGVSGSAAEDMAEVLAEIGGDDEAMSAFLNGESGDRSWFQFRGDFDQVERQFESELDSMQGGLESLENDLSRGQIRHDAFLTDPHIAPIRQEVFDEMGAVVEPPEEVNGLGEMFNEATREAGSAQTRERAGIALINTVTAVGAMAATAGLGGAMAFGAGLATGAAQAVPDVAEARQQANHAQGAVATDMAPPELLERAKEDEAVAYAMNAAGVLAGAAISNDAAAVGVEAVNQGASAAMDVRE